MPSARRPLPCGLSSSRRKTYSTTWRRAAGIASRIAAVSLALMSAGCAYSYVDSNNVRHIVGLVDVAIPSAGSESSNPVASAVSVTSVGLYIFSGTANGGGVVLGYGKETVLTMTNNACVDLNAVGPCASAALPPSRETVVGMNQP